MPQRIANGAGLGLLPVALHLLCWRLITPILYTRLILYCVSYNVICTYACASNCVRSDLNIGCSLGVPRQQSVPANDEGEVRPGVQDLHTALHHLPLVSRPGHAVQEDRGLSDVCKDEERVPDLPARSGVWTASTGVVEFIFSLRVYSRS